MKGAGGAKRLDGKADRNRELMRSERSWSESHRPQNLGQWLNVLAVQAQKPQRSILNELTIVARMSATCPQARYQVLKLPWE